MNRTIKFRGKTVNGNKWVYGDLLHIAGGYIIYHGSQKDCEITTGKHVSVELLHDEISVVVPETIGQFTGLFDKNGKGIYEGDIVEQIVTNGYDYGFIGEVGFDNGVFGIKHKTYKGYIVSRFVYSSHWNDGHAHGTILYEYELKGNIYDNPELIKEEL